MSTETIVVCFPVSDLDVQTIQSAAGPNTRLIVSSQGQLPLDILEADIFCGHAKVPIDWEAVVQQGRLRWIQSSAAGLDHCLTPPVVQSSIVVSGCSGLFANQVAEQTLALTLGLVRRMPEFYQAQSRHEFERRPTDDLTGATVGLLGFGGNGQKIAECLLPMAGRVIATDLFADQVNVGGVEVRPAKAIQSIFAESKFVISTLPLTSVTNKLVGRECFELMSRESYFINVGRGAVVDHDALVERLTHGMIAGVGLDVVDPEPLPPEHPLWLQDNVLITPHVGAQSRARVPSTVRLFLENMRRFRAGQKPINWVDRQLGFPRPEYRLTSQQRTEMLAR